MAEQPWFKFFAADYLLDPDVDAMPREAEALLVRMWCICHREGSCPADIESLSRKTQCSQDYVSRFKSHCEPFFEFRDGRLFSRRMEEEKRRSEQARANANKRYQTETAVRSAVQMAVPRSDSDFVSGFNGLGSVSVSKENAHSREARKLPTPCRSCSDLGFRHVPGHPGEQVYCGCPAGEALRSTDKAASA